MNSVCWYKPSGQTRTQLCLDPSYSSVRPYSRFGKASNMDTTQMAMMMVSTTVAFSLGFNGCMIAVYLQNEIINNVSDLFIYTAMVQHRRR